MIVTGEILYYKDRMERVQGTISADCYLPYTANKASYGIGEDFRLQIPLNI